MKLRIMCQFALGLLSGMPLLSAQTQLLPQNQEINLRATESLLPAQAGKIIQMTVNDAVRVDGITVVEAGAAAEGLIVRVEKDGEVALNAALLPVSCYTVDGQLLYLQGAEQVIDLSPALVDTGWILHAVSRTDVIVQGAIQDPAPQAVNLNQPDKKFLFLPAGFDIMLQLSDECIPANVEVGMTLRLRVKQDVIEKGKLAFPAKSPGLGRVKFINDHQIFIVAFSITAADGQNIAVETDNSIAIEFDPEKEDELLILDAEIPAMLSVMSRISIQ